MKLPLIFFTTNSFCKVQNLSFPQALTPQDLSGSEWGWGQPLPLARRPQEAMARDMSELAQDGERESLSGERNLVTKWL